MLKTEGMRVSEAPCPCDIGSLWFCPRLSILWQVVKIYGTSSAPQHAVVELFGFLYAEGVATRVRRRLTLPELVDRFLYFGSVHNQTWRAEL